jgi:electron transport complex protein RnfG
MSNLPDQTPHKTGSNRWFSVLTLILFAVAATLAVNLVERNTRQSIADNQTAYAMRVVGEVLPAIGYDNEPHLDIVWLSDEDLPGSLNPLPAYRARLNQQLIATAITVIAENGYVGPIRLLVGIDARGKIIRVRTSEHRETPGLGDKIELGKSDWITQFDGAGRDTEASWTLRQDGGELDHISGATITSRAVIAAVRATLEYYLENVTVIDADQPEFKN